MSDFDYKQTNHALCACKVSGSNKVEVVESQPQSNYLSLSVRTMLRAGRSTCDSHQ